MTNVVSCAFQELGTLDHRFVCKAIVPSEGWPEMLVQARLAAGRIGQERLRLLQMRGLLVLRVPAPPVAWTEVFSWIVAPAESEDAHLHVWYLDGSMLDGDWVDLRAVGFAIVVVSQGGDLVAYGRGSPPSWCTTAAAAEAWALSVALQLCPFPPDLRTDCLSLLRTAEGGLSKAVAANRPLARIWGRIGCSLDADITCLVRDEKLVWVPAHQTTAAIGNKELSNGQMLTAVDWRANRLVDALAKQAARERQAPPAITRLLTSGKVAVNHAAALLGEVTHAANHCSVQVHHPDGSTSVKICRDAQKPAQAYRGPRERSSTEEHSPLQPAQLIEPDPPDDTRPCTRPASCSGIHRPGIREMHARRRDAQRDITMRQVSDIVEIAVAVQTRDSVLERRNELLRRVRARAS